MLSALGLWLPFTIVLAIRLDFLGPRSLRASLRGARFCPAQADPRSGVNHRQIGCDATEGWARQGTKATHAVAGVRQHSVSWDGTVIWRAMPRYSFVVLLSAGVAAIAPYVVMMTSLREACRQ